MDARQKIEEALELVAEAGMFAIEPGGLRRLGRAVFFPNQIYYMGASSSPNAIFVTKVTDRSIAYRDLFDLGKERHVQRPIADDLIQRGSETMLKGRYAGTKEGKKLRKLLDGKKQPPEKLADWKRHKVTIQAPSGKEKDTQALWYEAEKYGGVGGFYPNYPDESVYHLTIEGVRGYDLPKVKGNRKWKVLKVEPYHPPR